MSHSQFHCIKSFILRHAWLNLWDKHMTTGRINQVTIVRVNMRFHKETALWYADPHKNTHPKTGIAMNPGALMSWVRNQKKHLNQGYCFCLLWLHPSSEVLSYSDTPQHMIVKRELGPRADKASVCFASHRTLESRTKLQQFKHNSHVNVSARRWVRRTDSVGSSCAVPASK